MNKNILLLTLFFSVKIFSQSSVLNDEFLYEKFLENAYDFNFIKTTEIINKLRTNYPNSPLYFHAKSLLNTWYYLGTRNEGTLRDFFLQSDSALIFFEKTNNIESNPYYLFGLAKEHAFRALMYIFDYNELKAFWATKKSISYFNEIIDNYPNFYDAETGEATFGYYLSSAPSYIKTALYLFGINTDVKKSILSFEKIYRKGKIAKTDAAFQLAKIYSDYYYDIKKSDYYIKTLLKKYPHNIFFKYQYAVNKIKENKFDSAKTVLTEITKYKNENFIQIRAFSHFLLGEIYFILNDFSSAITYYEKYFQLTQSINFLGFAYYKCGISSLFIEDTLKAKNYFLLASYGNPDNPKDKFANSESLNLLETDFTGFDKNLFLSENYILQKDFKQAQKHYMKIKEPNSIKALLIKAEIFININEYKKAKKTLNEIGEAINDVNDKIKFYYLSALNAFLEKNFSLTKKYLAKLFELPNVSNEYFAKGRNLANKIGFDF